MKISELQNLTDLQKGLLIPISIAGKNFSVTLGQIIELTTKAILQFDRSQTRPTSTTITEGNDSITNGDVIFEKATLKFYMAIKNTASGAGSTLESWTYYKTWKGSWQYYDSDGVIRKDAIFADKDGKFYVFTGSDLIRAGMTQEEVNQLGAAEWIKVTEDEMETLIKNGQVKEGQVYYSEE